MRFLVDAQLPPALARRLSADGHRAEHVADHGLQGASDSAIWIFASEIGATIITKDEDFAQRRLRAIGGPTIVWLRLPNSRKGALFAAIDAIMPRVIEALERGETLIEIV